MCGIVGVVRLAGRDVVERMTRLVAHRGPDDAGIWQEGEVVLGHRRLSILDLSPSGHQPMLTDDGESAIVYNGEIYNFVAVRAELERLGHRFRSHSDTEVVLLGYREWGDGVLERIEGIFAFGLWDAVAGRLLLARDRSGVKPLFWYQRDGGLAFSSELKPFRLLPGFVSEVNRRALRSTMRFVCNLEEESMLVGVRKLAPGGKLVWQSGRVQLSGYWSYPEPRPRPWSPRDAAASLRDVLGRTVRSQMISDAPLGAALSGGIDSSGIVALMAENGAKVRTYTVGHGSADPDLIAARRVADHCRTEHHEILIESEDLADLLPRVTWFLEEPLGQMETAQMYLNYQAASKHVKVLLVGEGADELFAGYDRFKLFDASRMLTPGLREALYERFYLCADRQPRHRLARLMAQAAFGHLAPSPMADPLPRAGEPPIHGLQRERAMERAMNHDQRTYLHHLSLKRADATGMAHGVELRVPFLGRAVVELAASFPGDLSRRGGVEKWVLREAVRPLLPAAIVERRKRPFQMQIDRRLVDTLQRLCELLLPPDRVRSRGFFDPELVAALRAGRPRRSAAPNAHVAWAYRMWAMVMAEVWARLFLDRPPEAPPPATLDELIATG